MPSTPKLYDLVGTPAAVVQMLNRQVNAVLQRADLRERLIAQGFEPAGGSAQELGRFIRDEIGEYAKLIAEAGIKQQ